MAQIVTITNPLTGQPAQVDQLDHTAQEIDDAIDRAKTGGEIDLTKLPGIESTDYPGCYYRMVGGVVEWVNPPMQLGVEYRTTERYLGKPVYAKLINCGNLPNNGTTTFKHGIANIDYVVSASGSAKIDTGWTFTIPSSPRLPMVSSLMVSKEEIIVTTNVDWSEYALYVSMKYTKTTG